MAIQLIIFSILFLSSLIRSTFGFGDALIAMPLLSMVMGVQFATPLVALISMTIASLLLVQHRHGIHFNSMKLLSIYTIIGIPIGLLMLKGLYEPAVKFILALVLIGFSAYKIAKPKLFHLVDDKLAFLFGMGAGILGGAYNTNGPPVIIYGTLRQWPPEQFRATLQGYFLITGTITVLSHGLVGLWTTSVWLYYILSLPIVFISIGLGRLFHRQIPINQFDNYIYVFLMVIGIMLFVDTLPNLTKLVYFG